MEGSCPKCGSTTGWNGPTYGRMPFFVTSVQIDNKEYLAYTCVTCGYEKRMPTKDSRTPIPPAPELDPGVTVRAPAFPPNRILKGGELPCRVCGSGRSAHRDGRLGHPFPPSRWLLALKRLFGI
jgi:predicted nucleic-acid-binding Zn-ribbon protein